MRPSQFLWPKKGSHLPLLVALGIGSSAFAQITTFPVVTIKATDPLASWSGDTGTFTVFRDGPTNADLNVYYAIGGSASNSVDYTQISHWVSIPAGITSNTITISPINNRQTNIETVDLKLVPSPMLPPVNYAIGYPAAATVFITPEGVTNIPPLARLTSPPDGAVFYSPVDVPLVAIGADPDGVVTSMEFFDGDTSLGVETNWAVVDPPGPGGVFVPGSRAFFLTWTNAPVGMHTLTAKATDDGGASTVSEVINITIKQGPSTNLPPLVKIAEPMNGAKFLAPANIGVCALAYDLDGQVTTVEFFAGTISLGVRTNNPMSAGPMNPFCLVWSNVPAGDYVLTAKATDNDGASTVSDPVSISVVTGPPPPPPTNYPPVVRITSPPNGAFFRSPVNVPIYTYAHDRDGTVTSVEFFEGTNSLGLGQGLCLSAWPGTAICPTNIFMLVWSNPPVGSYALTAVATDNGGASNVSPIVNITIVPGEPPPTNRPPIVSILATDPLAIEGTNCWPWLGLATAQPTWSNWLSGGIANWQFFTNCGPKNASFTVRRYGDTNDDLTVNYAIGGTATNGVDYVPLSGSVTIPAGQRRAEIDVVPLDDGPPDINSTVVLKLMSGTNYVLGFPRSAAALILDQGAPRSGEGMLPGNAFHLSSGGPDGAWFHIDYSTDLINWTTICTNQVVNGSIDFIDPDTTSSPSRFYRTVPDQAPGN
jgi:hypothetical protein